MIDFELWIAVITMLVEIISLILQITVFIRESKNDRQQSNKSDR